MNDILSILAAAPHRNAGDYTGADGLLYCGCCHTPKEIQIPSLGVMPITCQCREQALQDAQEARRRSQVEELRQRCLPMASMHRRTFAAAEDAPYLRQARRYATEGWEEAKKNNLGLLFWGNTGTGKTYAAQCIANALIDREISVLYISAVELVSALTDRERREQLLDGIRRSPLMIIDDLGAERDSSFSREQLCHAVDVRSEAGKPLIVTTNVSLEEMKRCTDPSLCRLYDRLLVCCSPVAVTGKSRRAEIARQKLKLAGALLGE